MSRNTFPKADTLWVRALKPSIGTVKGSRAPKTASEELTK
jgi:hypothetical protein